MIRHVTSSFIVSLSLFFSQCVSKDTEKNKPVHPPKKSAPVFKTKNAEKEPALVVKTDTINKENAVAFLEAYGNKHPETLVVFETRLELLPSNSTEILLYTELVLSSSQKRDILVRPVSIRLLRALSFREEILIIDHKEKRIQYNYRIRGNKTLSQA